MGSYVYYWTDIRNKAKLKPFGYEYVTCGVRYCEICDFCLDVLIGWMTNEGKGKRGDGRYLLILLLVSQASWESVWWLNFLGVL